MAIVTAYREGYDLPEFAQIDMSIMMENLWFAADEIGLGGVWLGVAPREERMKDVEKIVGIPAGQRPSASLLLGYPDEERTQLGSVRSEQDPLCEIGRSFPDRFHRRSRCGNEFSHYWGEKSNGRIGQR